MEDPNLKIERIRRKLGIDTRLCVFELSEGFLKISDAKIIKSAGKLIKHYFIKTPVKLLPDKELSLRYGVCNVGTAPVFKEPSMRSEQTTQIILGETFDVLEIKDDWVRIRLHFDGYIGWVYKPQMDLMDSGKFSEYMNKPKVEFTSNFGFVYSKPDVNSTTLRDVVVCSVLNYLGSKDGWLKVELPDGTYGFIRKSEAKQFKAVKKQNISDIIQTAKRFLGVSYVWGGKTPKGFDCSGFVQTVYRINGIQLPRDSDMQWEVGKYIGKNFSKFKKGDLLFFSSDGRRITHVGIFTGRGKEIIHASGFVRLNSLDKGSGLYSERLERTFVGARRVFNFKKQEIV
ncbi:C40 family peptidase [Candidatus Kryptonium thompsonii]|uniref:C40 family peptidase n=1 Tax=Candidatus Kryptonium thompsonii TaxID=1633631 RepID=UPI0007082985|nr:NlpC/P60 family protein [Candidatus Kryptonium thompsoni]CUS91441.1 Cell wall-associated hydrolase, NlpC family [Candidatus Kryptonium thompsoni]